MMANTYKTTIKSVVIGLFALLMITPAIAIAQFAGGDGSAASPFQIETKEQLDAVRNNLTSHFVLNNDIVFDAADFQVGGLFYRDGAGWLPIGGPSLALPPFEGVFNGNGFTISGLKIDVSALSLLNDHFALFGVTQNATIENLTMAEVDISASNTIGVAAIVGRARVGTLLRNNHVESGQIVGDIRVGGIVGRFGGGSPVFDGNSSSATVSGIDRVGGVIGIMENSSQIRNSYSDGTVIVRSGSNGNAGGLVGVMQQITSIVNSYSSANIIVENSTAAIENGVGGLLGAIRETATEIRNSYATGTITVLDRASNSLSVGGLVGRMDGAQIIKSYASVVMDFDTSIRVDRTGGLVGSFSGTLPIGAVQGSFWNSDVSGLNSRGVDVGEARTTQQMKTRSTFTNAGWDFTDTWRISRLTSMPFLNGVSRTVFAGPQIGNASNVEGWRHLGSSLSDVNYSTLLGSIWTQGVPGSNNPASANPNIFAYDLTINDWIALPDMDSAIPTGTGFAVYVFSADFDGQPVDEQGFPKNILVEGSMVTDNYQAAIHPQRNGWSLVSNSFIFPINWQDVFGANSTDIDPVVYVYDPRVSEPGYRIWNGDTNTGDVVLDGRIAPFQGFFIRTERSGATQMTVPASAQRPDRNSNLLTRNPSESVISLGLNAKLVGQERERNAMVVFSEFETSNGLALAPMDGIPYVEFAVLDQDGALNRMYNVTSAEGTYTLPLVLRNLEFSNNGWFEQSGEFEISWSGLSEFPSDWQFSITDTYTGEVIDLRDNQSAVVQIDVAQSTSDEPSVEWTLTPQAVIASVSESRFLLNVVAGSPVSIGEGIEAPLQVSLDQNYPNPFNPATTIRYTLSSPSDVRLDVFNLMGQRVASLQDGFQQTGTYTVNFDASNLSSGVYVYRLQAGGHTLTRKMTLVK
ncbi:MAG: T9SS type A sorting domain-containing protein [Balneolales bacterium]|nr:T9SS type A sorting domain-containing protein [Balneolales bacterium]